MLAEELYGRFPQADEGDLSRLLHGLVRLETLARIANDLGVAQRLRFDRRPVGSGLHAAPSDSMLADAMEAVFGAIFLDTSYEAARKAILHVYAPLIEKLDASAIEKDPKTRLQEALHAKKLRLPEYRVISQHGAPQNIVFEVECVIAQRNLTTTGSGTSRQRAEQEAAKAMLEKLQ